MIFKKIFDILFSIVLLLLSFPVILIFMLLLFIELKSFPIFKQERGISLKSNRFNIYKLKTIKPRDKNIPHTTEQDIFLKTSLQDKVTPFAKWLRKTGLDELPQLINVIMGQMSLVGPRPLMIEDLETMKLIKPELYERRSNLKCKPGITGLWQLFGNRNEGILGMIALETLYEKVASPFLDLKLLLYTTSIVIQAKNSDSIFYVEKAHSNRVRTLLGSSSNLKVTLNMPEGIARFIIENVNHAEGKYTVEIPKDWWYVSDTYESAKRTKKQPDIFNIEDKSKKSAS